MMMRCAASLLAFTALACQSAPGTGPRPPEVPPELAVPEGNVLSFRAAARGVQIYACKDGGWTLDAPEAVLLDDKGAQVGTHGRGPTWKNTAGDTIAGKVVARSPRDPAAVPWLLLQATPAEGSGDWSKTSYIHRVDTTGGNPPATGCDAAHLGTQMRVPYTAVYYFYRAAAS